MTVIAYRDGVMAADSAVWQDDLIVGHTQKIKRLRDGRLFAGCGPRWLVADCFAWLDGHGDRPAAVEKQEFGALLVGRHKIEQVIYNFAVVDITEISPWAVEGCHTNFMLGVLAHGGSAEEAVSLAIRYGDSAGGEVQSVRV